jgi:hypothetical protein
LPRTVVAPGRDAVLQAILSVAARFRPRLSSRHELAAQLVLNVYADDVLERVLRRKAQLAGAACVEAARPAGDDPDQPEAIQNLENWGLKRPGTSLP